jgi:pyruvate dehydrogenase E2 component (dihydrolipoamide acetyltransferase)
MAERPIRMPALSATMEDAELLGWLVAVGDSVRSGQPLAEVSTDKVDMELESPYDGVVARILAEPGTRVALGEIVLVLTSDEDDLLGDLDLGDGAPAADAQGPPPAPETATAPAPPPEPAPLAVTAPSVAASPLVRREARRRGIDLTGVTGTGSRGQITRADLERAGPSAGAAAAAAAGTAPGAAPGATPGATSAAAPRPATGSGSSAKQRAIRLATARTTIRSAAIPQFTLFRRLDVGPVDAQRQGRSWVTEIARALAGALARHPECNATWDEEQGIAVPLPGVRIGIAVDSADGLLVVAVDDPDAVSAAEADRAVREAIDRAREGRVLATDLKDVSSSISSLGSLGVDRFNALLVPPQPTILSVGRIVDTPVVVDGRVGIRPMMEVGLTVDHRVADGADAARMLDTFIRRLGG